MEEIKYHLSKELCEVKEQRGIIYFNHNINISIWVYGNQHSEIPYFILFDNTNPPDATKCARIYTNCPKYIIPSDCDIPHWNLSYNDKIKLLEILQSENKIGDIYWNYIIWQYLVEYFGDTDIKINMDKYPIPNYLLL